MKYSTHRLSGPWVGLGNVLGRKLDTTRNYLAVQEFFSSLFENYSEN